MIANHKQLKPLPVRDGPAAASAGLYVHFPWCIRICTYCDFDRQAHAFDLVPAYVEALATEIQRLPRIDVHSVFFGGGTPSLMSAVQVGRVMDAARSRFRFSHNAEVTLETNPDDTEGMDFPGLIAAGVNRISMGVQNLDDRWLRLLVRRHSAEEAREAARRVRLGGIDNLNLDLMFGLPGLGLADWRATLEAALELGPDHLSCYLLTVDESVPLGRDVAAGRLAIPDDDALSEQYALTMELLAEAGFEQYEISNWARPGRQSRHNLTYWRDEPYLGVGAGAASCWQGRRSKNSPVVKRYLAAVEAGTVDLVEDEQSDWLTALEDHLGLLLRLREGLDLDRFEARFGRSLDSIAAEELRLLGRAGILERNDTRLRVGSAHLMVTNEVLARLRAAIEQTIDSQRVLAGSITS